MSETVDKKNLLTSKEVNRAWCYGCSIIRPVTIMSV